MAKEVKIPQISEGVESATVAEVLVSEGDSIEKEQSLITVESDKASVEVPSPYSGTVKEIKVKEGDEVKVGDVIVVLEESGEEEDSEEKDEKEEKEEKDSGKDKKKDKKEKKKSKEEEEESEEEDQKKKEKKSAESEEEDEEEEKREKKKDEDEEQEEESEEDKEDKEEAEEDSKEKEEKKKEDKEEKKSSSPAAASPGVRRLARELGVDINTVEGSGENRRITEDDVKKKAKKGSGGAGGKELSLPDFSKWGDTQRKPLSGIRKATAKNVTASWQAIPHVFQFEEADITGIEEYMKKNAETAEKAGGKLTITAILVKIAADALQHFPKFNASIDLENEEMVLKKYMNIGIAVDTEKGLLVPVIRDVDKKSIIELSVEISEIAQKARDGKLSSEEMQGGNFTISNLGGIGGTNFTPIVPNAQVAILGVSRAKKQPVFIEGKFEARDILPLSLSYDHRLIDGAEGAEFINWIAQALEDPYKALLGA